MITVLQDIFQAVMKPFFSFSNGISQKTKNILMTGSFYLIIVLFCMVRILRKNEYHGYYSLIGCFLMFFIAVLSLDKELKRIRFSKPLAYSWLGLCLVMIVSDFKVQKVFSMIGYIFLFVFTLVFYIWNNHSKREVLLANFMRAVRMSFLTIVILSFLFRPRIEDYRYAGTFINPNMLGLYLIIIFSIYLVYLDLALQKKYPLKKCIGLFIEIGFSVFLLYMTESRTSMFSAGMVGLIWFSLRFYQARKEQVALVFGKYIIIMGCIVVVCFPVAYKLLEIVPQLVNHPVKYEHDQNYVWEGSDEFGLVAKAVSLNKIQNGMLQEEKDSSSDGLAQILSKEEGSSLDNISSGRITVYKKYISKLNIWGHKKLSIKIDGQTIPHAHNNVLQFGFSYGYFAMIPYTLLNIFVALRSIKYYIANNKKSIYAFLPMGIVIGFTLASMIECIFLPFENFPAFAYWLVIGILLPHQLQNN